MSKDLTPEQIHDLSDQMEESGFKSFEEFSGITEETVLATIREFRKVQRGAFAPCPRCGHYNMADDPIRNALSRYADIYVCDSCGTDEALRDFAGVPLRLTEWAIAYRGSEYRNSD